MADPFRGMGLPLQMLDAMTGNSSTALTPLVPPMHSFSSMQLSPFVNMGVSSFSSSVVSMTTDEYGRQQIYQETRSQRCGPGGVRETKAMVRDSRTGRQEMQVGHHIQEKSHVVKRSRNAYNGQEEQEEDFINLAEEECEDFERQYRQKIGSGPSRRNGVTITELPSVEEPIRLALPAPPSNDSRVEIVEVTDEPSDTSEPTESSLPHASNHRDRDGNGENRRSRKHRHEKHSSHKKSKPYSRRN